jgi:hypothetical protein
MILETAEVWVLTELFFYQINKSGWSFGLNRDKHYTHKHFSLSSKFKDILSLYQ